MSARLRLARLALVVGVALLGACGIKGDPRPPTVQATLSVAGQGAMPTLAAMNGSP